MVVDIHMHFGRRLRLRRQQLGLRQKQVAEPLGLTFQQIQKYESGASKLSGATLWRLADVLEVPITYFYDGLPLRPSLSQSQSTGAGAPNTPSPRPSGAASVRAALSDPAT